MESNQENTEAPSIQVLSDVHLEHRKGKQPNVFPMAKYAALLGDIGYPDSKIYKVS